MRKVRKSDRAATPRLRRLSVPPFAALSGELTRDVSGADAKTRAAVERIVKAVRKEGDVALARFQKAFDRATLKPTQWEVPWSVWEQALKRVPKALHVALDGAAARIRDFAEKQMGRGFEHIALDGSRLAQRLIPLERVGVYVPGGRAVYPSTVLMTVIPAKVAGVKDVVVVTPPGGVCDVVLAACAYAKADRLFLVGGAQAIAALAYGTKTIPRVDKIVGPGNKWVAEAKRLVSGTVGIDMIAGPTEVLVIADDSVDPRHVAADLIAQAEHDEDASAWLVTPHVPLIDAVDDELDRQLRAAPRAAIARVSLEKNGMAVVVPDVKTAIEVANLRAPEHLQLLVREPGSWVEQVRHAGAVFLGPLTPEHVGDYIAGPSHVLPTGGTARFASPLGVYDFAKRMSVIEYTRERLELDARDIIALAEAEGLPGHAEAVRVRLEGGDARRGTRDE